MAVAFSNNPDLIPITIDFKKFLKNFRQSAFFTAEAGRSFSFGNELTFQSMWIMGIGAGISLSHSSCYIIGNIRYAYTDELYDAKYNNFGGCSNIKNIELISLFLRISHRF